MKLELDRYNDRLDLLIHNEDYNFNKNKIINDTKTLTESIFAFIDCTKQNPFRFTPSLFEYKFTQLIESEDYKFVKYNLTEDFRKDEKLSYIVTDIENQIFRLFKTYIYRGIRANIGVTQMREEFKIHYLRANEFLKNSENDAETEEYINDSYDKMFDSVYKSCQGKIDNAKSHSIGADLSIKLNNSFRINFERLFPRCGSTTRALYQTLCRMAESNGDSIIQYTSFKALALKCSTKIGHDTIKSLLHKLHDGKLINYIWKTINGREFIESIQILDNSEFVTLQKTVDTKFFKSDLASIPSIGKRGNELFWILNDYENGLTKKEIFRMFPGVSTTTPITKKLNELLKLGFVSLEGKIYKTDFNNFLLKLDDAKQNITRTVTVKSKVVSFKNGIQRLKYKNNRDTIKNYDREKLKKTIELGNIVRDNLVSDEEKENFSMRQFIRENLLPEEFDLVSKIKKTYNIASSHYVVRQFQKYQEESAHYRDLKKKEEIKTQLKEEKKLLKKVI
ncbi:hypothetical protein EHR07_17430 [Leptospira bandrabouensis]|nr:hypothetical protein EHR07_17430 [Leptospira bandrabouensis]